MKNRIGKTLVIVVGFVVSVGFMSRTQQESDGPSVQEAPPAEVGLRFSEPEAFEGSQVQFLPGRRTLGNALRSPVSQNWAGYWQRTAT